MISDERERQGLRPAPLMLQQLRRRRQTVLREALLVFGEGEVRLALGLCEDWERESRMVDGRRKACEGGGGREQGRRGRSKA